MLSRIGFTIAFVWALGCTHDRAPVAGDSPAPSEAPTSAPASGDTRAPAAEPADAPAAPRAAEAPAGAQPAAAAKPAPAGRAGLADGLIAHYSFDGGSLRDQTGNGFDAEAVSGADCTVQGAFGQGCALDEDGHLQVARAPVPRTAPRGLSGAAWFKTDELGLQKYIYSQTSTEAFTLKFKRGMVLCTMKDRNRQQPVALSPRGARAGAWHHGACVYDPEAGTMTAYLDGEPGRPVPVRDLAELAGSPRQGMGIGCHAAPIACGTGVQFSALVVDDIRLWARALSAEEVRELASMRSR
ncbi:MAG: hypothetical protein OXT09_34420 [Myxococcales bacterium]|nr:hypothetical protein [Myxococcales bacterium]